MNSGMGMNGGMGMQQPSFMSQMSQTMASGFTAAGTTSLTGYLTMKMTPGMGSGYGSNAL